ncbi:hypothetical protein VE00_07271 [Pseudogymnoascus sp. WSF 3629]|nr:hypothetical protein VE00_07271 [Pseudogymnoascus sp. WSF 3629]
MAEPFGIVAGTVGIASAFSACVDCFDYVQQARHFGRDFQTNVLTLDCARLRLTRWGDAVDVYGDPQLGRPTATKEEVQLAKETLFHILKLFAKTSELSKNYKRDAKPGDDLSVYRLDDLDAGVLALHGKLKDQASKRQKNGGFLKTTSWAIYGKKEFKELLDGIVVLVDNLEKLFPAPERQDGLVKEDLKIVDESGESVNASLKGAAKEALVGHQYANIDIQGKALMGDSFAAGWQGKMAEGSHNYDGVVVGANAKAQLGNTFGQKGFWDD